MNSRKQVFWLHFYGTFPYFIMHEKVVNSELMNELI